MTDLKLTTLLAEILDFNKIKTLPIRMVSDSQFYVTDTAGHQCNIYFTEISTSGIKLPYMLRHIDTAISIGFDIEDDDTQFKITDLSGYLPILKAVVDISIKWVESNEPELLVIVGTSRYNSALTDDTKNKIYKMLAQKNLPLHYAIGRASVGSITGICIYKKASRKQ